MYSYYPHAEYSTIKILHYLLLDFLEGPEENKIYHNKIFVLFFTLTVQNSNFNFPKVSKITVQLEKNV